MRLIRVLGVIACWTVGVLGLSPLCATLVYHVGVPRCRSTLVFRLGVYRGAFFRKNVFLYHKFRIVLH